MKKYKIVQVKSSIGRPERQKRTLIALGLRKLNNPIVVKGSLQVEGMINAVKHLLHVEEVTE